MMIPVTNSKHQQPGEPPLDQFQPVFTRTSTGTINGLNLTSTYHSATLLHQLAIDGSVSTLERRIDELTPEILNNTKCWEEVELEDGTKVFLTEVRERHTCANLLLTINLLSHILPRCPRSTLLVAMSRLSLRSPYSELERCLIWRQGGVKMADSPPHSSMLLLIPTTAVQSCAKPCLMLAPQLGWEGVPLIS